MADKPQNREIQQRLARIEELIQAVDGIADEKGRSQARELVEALLEMQGAGLERLMQIIYDSGPAGQSTIDELGRRRRLTAGVIPRRGAAGSSASLVRRPPLVALRSTLAL